MHFVLSCDYSDYIIRNVLTHFGLCNPKQYDTTHAHVLVHVEWGVNTIYLDYIIRNALKHFGLYNPNLLSTETECKILGRT